MALSEIDISEANLIPLATTLAGHVATYNTWVQAINGGTEDLSACHHVLTDLLTDIYDLAKLAYDAIQPLGAVIEPLGMPDDFGWAWELGQLMNATHTANQEISEELAAISTATAT